MTNRASLSTVSISGQLAAASESSESSESAELQFERTPPDQEIARTKRYAIADVIGRGGMGLVYRANDNAFDREVAIKVLLQTHQDRDEARQRFFEEARTTARLQHPGVVSVYDVGLSDDGQPYFAMKLVQGRTLGELLAFENRTPLQRARLLEIFSRVCQTIAFAHSHQTVHLDLKPSNVMVGAYGEVHVMDWGLSRQLDGETVPLTPIGTAAMDEISDDQVAELLTHSKIIGTPSYMAPEQACGRDVGVRTDVFGLGALLCEVLTGLPPYHGSNLQRVYRRAARGALREASHRLESCDADPALIALCKHCLARNADDRPDDAGTVAAEITGFRESSMERAERDLGHFFEISMDLFCIASLEGYFKRVNSNFSRVLGYTNSELVSKPFINFIHPEDVGQTMAAVKTLAAGKPIAEFRNRYRDSEGRFRWFEWTAKSIPEENIIFAVARVIEDPRGSTATSRGSIG
jgi:serine/threonine-protein kinase